MYSISWNKTFLTRSFTEKQYKTWQSEKHGQRPNLLSLLCHKVRGYQSDKRWSSSDVLCFTPLMHSKHFNSFLSKFAKMSGWFTLWGQEKPDLKGRLEESWVSEQVFWSDLHSSPSTLPYLPLHDSQMNYVWLALLMPVTNLSQCLSHKTYDFIFETYFKKWKNLKITWIDRSIL